MPEGPWQLAIYAAASLVFVWFFVRSNRLSGRLATELFREGIFWAWVAAAYVARYSAPWLLTAVWIATAAWLAVALPLAWRRNGLPQVLLVRVVHTAATFFFLVLGALTVLVIVLPDNPDSVFVRPPIYVCAPIGLFCFAMALRHEGFSAAGVHLRVGFAGWADIVRWSWRDMETLVLRLREAPSRPSEVKLYVANADRGSIERLLGEHVGPARLLDDDATRGARPFLRRSGSRLR